MQNKNRAKRNTGFTLVEMLIVVAIIAILVAVSIPLVSSSLENTRDKTDLANERSAKAEAAMAYLGAAPIYASVDGEPVTTYRAGSAVPVQGTDIETLYYDAESGRLVVDILGIDPYGKCSQTHDEDIFIGQRGGNAGDFDGPHKEYGIIFVSIDSNGAVTLTWTDGKDDDQRATDWGANQDDPNDSKVASMLNSQYFPEEIKARLKEALKANPDLTVEQFLTDEGLFGALWVLESEEHQNTLAGKLWLATGTSGADVGQWLGFSYLTTKQIEDFNSDLEKCFAAIRNGDIQIKDGDTPEKALYGMLSSKFGFGSSATDSDYWGKLEDLSGIDWADVMYNANKDHGANNAVNQSRMEAALEKAYGDYDKEETKREIEAAEDAYKNWYGKLTGHDKEFIDNLVEATAKLPWTELTNHHITSDDRLDKIRLALSKNPNATFNLENEYVYYAQDWMIYHPEDPVTKWFKAVENNVTTGGGPAFVKTFKSMSKANMIEFQSLFNNYLSSQSDDNLAAIKDKFTHTYKNDRELVANHILYVSASNLETYLKNYLSAAR